MSTYVVDASVAAKWFLDEDIYDSLYLCLAVVLGGKMVTADRRFFDAMADGPFIGNLLWIEDVPNESQNEGL